MWELQGHMHGWIAPSIDKAASEAGDERTEWLATIYADQRWDEGTGDTGYEKLKAEGLALAEDIIIEAIVDKAIEYGGCTNGGHAVYLDSWNTVSWCSEDEMQTWWANS